MNNFSILQHNEWKQVAPLRVEWNELALSLPDSHPFQLFEWHDAWWQSFGSNLSLKLFEIRRDKQLVGVIPLAIGHTTLFRLRLPTLTFIGTNNHSSDYAMPLFSTELSHEEQLSIFSESLDQSAHPSLIKWRNIREDSTMVAVLTEHAKNNRLGVQVHSPKSAHRYTVEQSEDFGAMLKRKSLKRAINYFRKQDSYTVTHLQDKETILQELDAFFVQHQERWELKGKPSQFSDPQQQTFYHHMVEALAPLGHIVFSKLSIQDQPIAYHLGFRFKDRFYWYKPSFEASVQSRSPGKALLFELFTWCKDNDILTFDFTVGDEAFKLQYESHSEEMLQFDIPQKQWLAWYLKLGSLARRIRKSPHNT